MGATRLTYMLGVGSISLLAAACGGEQVSHMQGSGSNTTSTAPPAAAPPPAVGAAAGTTAAGGAVAGSTGAAGAAAAAAGTTSTAAPAGGAQGGDVASITPQMLALGDSIFHGQAAGGTCFTCHGQNEKGTTLAPDLTDSEWLDGDGSYNYIVQRVTTGVPQPKQYPAPMPPMGGASLSQAQLHAVAAYVYSLSHPEVGKQS